MSISPPRTLRSFAVGFVLGAIAIATTVGNQRMPDLSNQVFPAAIAAPEQ